MYILGIFVVSANLNLVHIQQKEGAKGNEVTKSFFCAGGDLITIIAGTVR